MRVVSTNITSPLGMTTEENLDAVRAGRSALERHSMKGVDGFTASLFSPEQRSAIQSEGMTFFESLAAASAKEALQRADIDPDRTLFVLSTTKGNVGMLEQEDFDRERELPCSAAKAVARELGIRTQPVVVCNACISGLAALILAMRSGYDYAVVTGCDVMSRFFISGFQSFKALDPEMCRPFDRTRAGLNLGEAAATIVLGKEGGDWTLVSGAVRNDANHISGPSRTGEGSFRALTAALDGRRAAAAGVHGTGTLYNDNMEAIALTRAGLGNVPVMALKGYYGHTMGAAGVLETVLGMEAMDAGEIPPTKGFSEPGTDERIGVSDKAAECSGPMVKVLSGFGGCNAAVYMEKGGDADLPGESGFSALRTVKVTPEHAEVDGIRLGTTEKGAALLTELYRMGGEYPKFFKMDILSRLAVAAYGLIAPEDGDENTAVVLFNRSSSIVSDLKHEKATEEGFPSPSVFVYTLPNIMTGEIAIRYGYRSETSLYILDVPDKRVMDSIVKEAFAYDKGIKRMVTGWIDAPSEREFTADLKLLERIWKN